MRQRRFRRGNSAPDPGGSGLERRDQQLGRQAERILSLTFADLDDPGLEDLELVEVQAQHGCLTVVMLAPPGSDVSAVRDYHARLEAARGRLRSELARGLHRRRVPELVFLVDSLPGGGP
ncbi:MAG TPA: hypothetical protein VF530_14610 [Planctomycetota bacterium]